MIEKSGSWFSYGSNRLGQGRETVRKLLVENQELATELETKIRERIAEEPNAIKF